MEKITVSISVEDFKKSIKEIILREVETDSKYHGLDEYSVDTAVSQIMLKLLNNN